MPSFIIHDGRVIIASGVQLAPAMEVIRGKKADDFIPTEAYKRIKGGATTFKQKPRRAIGEHWDGGDGVAYQVYKHLDPKDGWCLSSQLMKHYGVPYRVILSWAQARYLHPGIEEGTPTRRYRVLDPRLVAKLADEYRKANTPKPVTPPEKVKRR